MVKNSSRQVGYVIVAGPSTCRSPEPPTDVPRTLSADPGKANRKSVMGFAGALVERPEGLYFEHQGNAAVRINDWKLVRARRKPWTLYDLAADRTEPTDLSPQYPDKTAEMQAKWESWAENVGVQSWPIKKKMKRNQKPDRR